MKRVLLYKLFICCLLQNEAFPFSFTQEKCLLLSHGQAKWIRRTKESLDHKSYHNLAVNTVLSDTHTHSHCSCKNMCIFLTSGNWLSRLCKHFLLMARSCRINCKWLCNLLTGIFQLENDPLLCFYLHWKISVCHAFFYCYFDAEFLFAFDEYDKSQCQLMEFQLKPP